MTGTKRQTQPVSVARYIICVRTWKHCLAYSRGAKRACQVGCDNTIRVSSHRMRSYRLAVPFISSVHFKTQKDKKRTSFFNQTRRCANFRGIPSLLCLWGKHGGHSPGFLRGVLIVRFWLAEAAPIDDGPSSPCHGRSSNITRSYDSLV